MKKCSCGSKDFYIHQMVQVKLLLNGDLQVVGNEFKNPKHLNGLIMCERCNKQYTEDSFKELEDIK